MIFRVIGFAYLLMCGALQAAQIAATNDHVVTVVNVNGITSTQEAVMMDRIAKLDAGFCELRAIVDGRLKVVERRAAREAVREEKIAERLDKACASAEEFYGKRYDELKAANDQFSKCADRWMTIMGWIISVASFLATIIPFVFGFVIPTVEMKKRNKPKTIRRTARTNDPN